MDLQIYTEKTIELGGRVKFFLIKQIYTEKEFNLCFLARLTN